MAMPLELKVQPTSGLSFPWAFEGKFNLSLGHDGVAWSEVMQINWEDLETAVQSLLGYSWKDQSTLALPIGVSTLRRKLPWQHPYFNQLWVKNITEVSGLGPPRKNEYDPNESFAPTEGGVGAGVPLNTGPWADFDRARINIQFWRPPYYIRSDEDILDENGYQQEWLRYVDIAWASNVQILTREGAQFVYDPSPSVNSGFPGALGQAITHQKVTRTWYEVPMAALFAVAQDSTPNGQALNLMYSQTAATNPITGYVYPVGYPLSMAVNSPIGGGTNDSIVANRLFGCLMGTLRYDFAEIRMRPLQLPPYLMQIPSFSNNEAIAQQQCDVVLHFDLFDPPRDPDTVVFRGHNLMPWSGNALWYPVVTKRGADGSLSPPFLTPHPYADLTDLFQILD